MPTFQIAAAHKWEADGGAQVDKRSASGAAREHVPQPQSQPVFGDGAGYAIVIIAKPFIQMKHYFLFEIFDHRRLCSLVSGLAHGSASLLTEMELSDSERSLNAARRPFSEIEEEDDVECDNPEPVSMTEATGEIKEGPKRQ